MEKTELTKKILAGVFFISGLVLMAVIVFILGKDKGLAQSKFQITVLYKNVGGLMEGAPVRLSGVNVGSVADIDFLGEEIDGRRVSVVLHILQRYRKQLAKDLRFVIVTEGILGEKLIEIYVVGPASGGQKKTDLTQPIIGEDPLDVQDLAEVFTKAAESFTKTSEELSKIDILELSNVMEESSRALLITARGINAMMDELQDLTKKSKRLLDRIEQRIIEGELFKVF